MFRWQKRSDILTTKQVMGDILRDGNKILFWFSREADFSSQHFRYTRSSTDSLRNAPPKSCKNTELYSKYSPFTPDKILTPKEIIYSL